LVNDFDITMSASPIPLTTHEAASGILGSISLACWIFLLLPQLVENYLNGSAEAISLAFIFVWFIGDVCNLAGALWAGLVPTVTAIAVYFCIADGVLISQCLYYRIRNQRREGRRALSAARNRQSSSGQQDTAVSAGRTETEPLLSRSRIGSGSITIPGSGRRRSSAASAASQRHRSSVMSEPLAKIFEESDEVGTRLWFKNAMSIIAIVALGTLGWAIAYESGVWTPTPESDGSKGAEEHMAAGAQVLGYLSAVAYLGARIPQIVKNARDKSCEGVSPFLSPFPVSHADW
jgi:solute carrier family 66 (lysosomal lysine-arginine transporter), member 1